MSEAETNEPDEPDVPTVADVPEPDQEPNEEEAEAEAEREREAEPESDVEPEAKGATQEDWEKRFTKSEARFKTYTRQVSDIYGDDAVNLIPVSISPSAPPGFLYTYDAGRVPDDVKAPILEFFGMAREQDYEPDPQAHECTTCKGKGLTATGSQVANNRTRDCPTCGGLGYESPEGSAGNGVAKVSLQHAPASAQTGPLDTSDRDNWGEPRILPNGERNQNYGLMPQYKQPHPTYGITANLTAQDAEV